MVYLEWGIWIVALTVTLNALYILIRRDFSMEEQAAVDEAIKEWGSETVWLVVNCFLILLEVVAVAVTAVTSVSKFHLIWIIPAIIIGEVIVRSLVGLTRAIIEHISYLELPRFKKRRPQPQLFWTGVVLLLISGSLTIYQIVHIHDRTAWLFIRVFCLPIPVLLITAAGIVIAVVLVVMGIWGEEA